MSRDALTGLHARDSYLALAQEYLAKYVTPARGAACLFYDISGMKAYNDRYGYLEGDALLTQIASILKDLYPDGIVARLESDHFVVIIGDKSLRERIETSLQALNSAERSQKVIVRVGVYPIASPNLDPLLVTDSAKLAADSIRLDPQLRYKFYDESFDRHIRMQRHVISSVDKAVENGWIKVYFQPVIRTLTNALCGLEALSRWDDPEYGMLSPADFIPPLENSQLIYKLDAFVIRRVCQLYRERTDASMPTVPISVNLSRLDFVACDIHAIIDEAVQQYNVPRSMLNIEITESTFIQDADIISHAMARFHESGHDVWMDDFGSGYSSLNVLKDYSFDELKLDMAFLSSFTDTSRAIVTSTVSMAKRIGIHTLAEGVETREQFEFLRAVGCEKAQGYYFGMPLPIDECMSLVRIHGLKVETPPWRRYFDTIGQIDFDTSEPIALIEDDGAEFHVLYLNKAAEEAFELLGVQNTSQGSLTAAFMRSTLSQRVRQNLEKPLAPGEEASITFFSNGQHARILLKGMARNGRNHMYQLRPTSLAHVNNPENMRLVSAAQVLCSACHDLQILSFENDTVSPVIGIGTIGIGAATHGIDHALHVYARHELYPLDINRFLNFIDVSTLNDRLQVSEGSCICDCFRSVDSKGDYVWRSYTICPLNDGTTDLVLYSRDISFETPIDFALKADSPTIDNASGITRDNLIALVHRIYDDMETPVSLANAETHKLLYLNPSAQETFGISEREAKAQPCYKAMRGEDMACASCREQLLSGRQHTERSGFNHKLNRYFNYRDTLISVDGETLRLELSLDMDSGQKAVFELAETDSLTGLLNRRGCDHRMSEAIRKNPNMTHAMVALDVNDFKLFNDLYGHAAGDALLTSVAHELREVFGPKCLIGRNGGDEFLVLIPNTTNDDTRAHIEAFSQQPHGFSYGGNNYRYGISAGYALYPHQTQGFVDLCRMADRALYHVKTNPGTWKCYEPQMDFESRTMLGFNLKDIVLGMPGAILVYRADGAEEILYANDELVRMFECDDMEDFLNHVGYSFKTLVHPGDIDRVEESIWNQVITNEENLDYVDYRIITKSGKVKDIWDSGRLVESPYYGNVFYVFMYERACGKRSFDTSKAGPGRIW